MPSSKEFILGGGVFFLIGALVVMGATGNLPYQSSAMGDQGPEDPVNNTGTNVATGEEATVSVAAFSQTSDSENQVETCRVSSI